MSAASQTAREPRYVRQFAEILEAIGPRAFKKRYPTPALVGFGLFGAIEQAKGRRTHKVQDNDDLQAIQSLLDRVWFVRRRVSSGSEWITLGQDSDNDIVIAEYTLSSRHCAFAWRKGRYALADLGSLNGTKAGSQFLPPRQPMLIHAGQPLTLGRIQMLFFDADGFIEHLQGGKPILPVTERGSGGVAPPLPPRRRQGTTRRQ